MSLRYVPVYPTLKIVYVAVILFWQGYSKQMWYITVNGRYLLEVWFSSVNTSLTQRNFYMSLRSTPVCSVLKMVYVVVKFSLQGRTKEIRDISLNGTFKGIFYLFF